MIAPGTGMLPDAEREAILRGNLERLLGVDTPVGEG